MVFDGLLEGKTDEMAEFEQHARDWLTLLEKLGPRFTLETAGRTFSLLPETDPIPIDRFGDSPEDDFRRLLEQFVGAVGPGAGKRVFSTLRSMRYRPGEVVQALYAVGPDGTVQLHSEVAEAETTPPSQPVPPKQQLRRIAVGLAVGLLILAASSWFVDWKAVSAALFPTRATIAEEDLTVEAPHFAPFFEIGDVAVGEDGAHAIVLLQRTEAYPIDDATASAAVTAAGDSVSRRLAVEALVRGYVRLEVLGPGDTLLYTREARIAGLNEQESVILTVPLGSLPGVRKVSLLP